MGVFALYALPTWRMLRARGHRMTFCTDHIHHYYHHCFSSNRTEHHIPMRPEPTKWENGQQFHWWKGEEGEQEREQEVGQMTVSCITTKTDLAV